MKISSSNKIKKEFIVEFRNNLNEYSHCVHDDNSICYEFLWYRSICVSNFKYTLPVNSLNQAKQIKNKKVKILEYKKISDKKYVIIDFEVL